MNIFENAKFGDKFVTREGRMAIIVGTYCRGVSAVLENDWGLVRYYSLNDNGKFHNCFPEKDIVDKWKEPINEENIKRLCVGARALCGVLDENGIDCPEKEFVSNMADNLMSELIK